MSAHSPDPQAGLFRILSLDSGGIYGLFSVMMLHELCRNHDPSGFFLKNGCVDLFAGTGAGAINALLLAKHEDPRDGIEDAIRFWKDERLYRNQTPLSQAVDLGGWLRSLTSPSSPRPSSDPWNAWWDIQGLGSWYSGPDVLAVLRSHFGELTLGDLKQNVLVTAFAWDGDPGLPAGDRHWKPKVYCNLADGGRDEARCHRMLVADIAFIAISWMHMLPVFYGEQGGDWYAPNPTLCAVSKAVNFLSLTFQEAELKQAGGDPAVLGRLSVLSVGNGARIPFLTVKTEEWGYMDWAMGAPNQVLKQWIFPLLYISSQGPTEVTHEQCLSLLNDPDKPDSLSPRDNGYHRLNPQVFETPGLMAMQLLRNNPAYLADLSREIVHASIRTDVGVHLRQTQAWMEAQGWTDRTSWTRWQEVPDDIR